MHDSFLVGFRAFFDLVALVVTPLELMLDTTGSGFNGFLHLAWFTSLLFSYPIKLPVIDILSRFLSSLLKSRIGFSDVIDSKI